MLKIEVTHIHKTEECNSIHDTVTRDLILKVLSNQYLIIQNQTKMSDVLESLKTELTETKQAFVDLQTSVDTMQGGINTLLEGYQTHITELDARIAELEALLAGGASAADLQPIIDDMKTMRDGIATTKADVESTLPTPVPGV